jgi:hypothetical protein
MSIVTLKRKSVTIKGTKQSGKIPGGYWVSQGPNSSLPIYGVQGFSLNGGTRFNTINKSMAFSQQGTRYRGQHPIGYGGLRGKYKQVQPLYNAGNATVEVLGNQHYYIKPSVLSTPGQIRTQYRWIHSGQYPNYWVQPIYPNGYLHENANQSSYIRSKSLSSICGLYDVNKNGPKTSSEYLKSIQQQCANNNGNPNPNSIGDKCATSGV